jgi:hypothetical protein
MADEQGVTPDEALAQIAFEAWRDYSDGNRLWSDVTGSEREAWEAAAGEVADAVRQRHGLPEDVRELLTLISEGHVRKREHAMHRATGLLEKYRGETP